MDSGVVRRLARVAVLTLMASAALPACSGGTGGVFNREYEYEEELYLSLDGSATLNVNASVDSLIALRGAQLDPDPVARVDRDYLLSFFGADTADVSISLARRDGRRFVHATVEVDDVQSLSRLAPFSWSEYELGRGEDVIRYRQRVGKPSGKASTSKWTGEEFVVFKMHLPSEIAFHNAPSGQVERGNILEWEQPLSARLAGQPLDIEVQFEPTSILANTLLLFGSTAVLALAALAGMVWWISRRGAEKSQ